MVKEKRKKAKVEYSFMKLDFKERINNTHVASYFPVSLTVLQINQTTPWAIVRKVRLLQDVIFPPFKLKES